MPILSKGILKLNSQYLNQSEVDDRIDYKAEDNVILVKQESDFGTAVGDEITLQDRTTYIISVTQLLLTKRLIIPGRGVVCLRSPGGFNTSLIIFVGSGTLFSGSNIENFSIFSLRVVDGVGTNQLLNFQSSPTFSQESVLTFELVIFVGWGLVGLVKNFAIATMNYSIIFQCGKWTLDNMYAFTFSNGLMQNFAPTGQVHVEILTNLSQANINASAFIPVKGDSIFNIDPAITSNSGVSFGTAVPYQGNVFGGVVKYEDLGGGQVKVIVNGGLSFDNGDLVAILNSVNYNGAYVISNVVQFQLDPTYGSIGTFDITAAFVADDGFGTAVLLDGAVPAVVPFFKEGLTGVITAYADNGAGGTRVTSTGHGLTNGQSLLITGDRQNDYDGGYTIFGATTNTFDIATPFVLNDAQGQWSTGSLDQTNNVITTLGTGGILPDSQALGNTILTSTVAFPSTTILTRISSGVWISDESERFKATNDGRLIYTGRSDITVSISASLVCKKQSGNTSTAFMNVMIKPPGAGSFTQIPSHPSSQQQVQASNPTQLNLSAFVENIPPFTELGIGFASDTAFTIDIFSIDFNIKK